jgi:hypothetical protein
LLSSSGNWPIPVSRMSDGDMVMDMLETSAGTHIKFQHSADVVCSKSQDRNPFSHQSRLIRSLGCSVVHFQGFKVTSITKYRHTYAMPTFRNLILTTFNSEPSIIKVGTDYYITTSTFTCFLTYKFFFQLNSQTGAN